jgi:hypothetical protein
LSSLSSLGRVIVVLGAKGTSDGPVVVVVDDVETAPSVPVVALLVVLSLGRVVIFCRRSSFAFCIIYLRRYFPKQNLFLLLLSI